ncbi:MAG TPA: hypothetical protein VFJ30_16150 [Phycisphaerae bacterium]|nr:hypothetical protein [Phycisphaerae bacterium]
MQHTMVLSDEELEELDGLLDSEVYNSRSELRRTRNPQFREDVRRRLTVARSLLAKIRSVHAAV